MTDGGGLGGTLFRRFLLTAGLTGTAFASMPASLSAQTPEQRFFDWTRLQFDVDEYRSRRAKLIVELRASGGGVFLTPSAQGVSGGETFRQLDDFLYLSGLELPASVLVVDADRKLTMLFVPPRDARFENASRYNDYPGRPLGDDPEIGRRSGITEIRSVDSLLPYLTRLVTEDRLLRVSLGGPGPVNRPAPAPVSDQTPTDALVAYLWETVPSAPIENAFVEIARLRMIKSPAEIARLRLAASVTAGAIVAAAGKVADGVDERRLEAEFESACKRGGSQRLAFASIIKSGPNSLWPWRILAAHYDRRNRTMHDGDLVIFDVGCEVQYYSSDIGRTFPVSGSFTPVQRETLRMVTAVSDAVIAAVKPGVTLGELSEIARGRIPPEHRRYMQTGSFYGHHIGLSTGDPSLFDAPLEPGMVFTVEPWYYNHDDGIAVFIEDEVLVTEGGAELLTRDLPRTPGKLELLVRRSP